MKRMPVIFFLLFPCIVWSQNLSNKDLMRLGFLGMDTVALDINNYRDHYYLRKIIRKDNAYKRNSVMGIVFGTLGVPLIFGGVVMTSYPLYPDDPIIPAMFILGTVFTGVSVPFFIASKKRTRQRGALIRKYIRTH